jgi:transposase
VDDNCTISLREIQTRLIDEFDVETSKDTVARSIDGFSYTLKRTSLIPERRDDENAIVSRHAYASNFLLLVAQEDGENIFFIDEVGFSVAMRARRGRSLVGTRAIQHVQGIRMKNISVCCSISKNGTFLFRKQGCPFNRESFLEYVNDLLRKFLENGITNAILVMDNVPFHKCREIREKISEAGHSLLLLPPYSPFLNPIENMFAQWKEKVKRENPRSEEELLELIDRKFEEITPVNCRNYYLKMLGFVHRCMNREAVNDG